MNISHILYELDKYLNIVYILLIEVNYNSMNEQKQENIYERIGRCYKNLDRCHWSL